MELIFRLLMQFSLILWQLLNTETAKEALSINSLHSVSLKFAKLLPSQKAWKITSPRWYAAVLPQVRVYNLFRLILSQFRNAQETFTFSSAVEPSLLKFYNVHSWLFIDAGYQEDFGS